MIDTRLFPDVYDIQERLGSGTGGVVYKAYHRRLRQTVVIKQIRTDRISGALQRREVDILKNLHHPYLPQVFDFLTLSDGSVYTVMSYIPGQSLRQAAESGRAFSQRELVRWGMQLCSALNCLHTQRPPILHADVKPDNIMLTPEGDICLIDFNVSLYLDGGAVLGYTEGYTSPEQHLIALRQRSRQPIPPNLKLNPTADIYSVGATLYRLATGPRLSSNGALPDLDLLAGHTSEAFARVIGKSLAFRPADRFPSAKAFFDALQSLARQDRRYRRLLTRQRVLRLVWTCLLSCALMTGGFGAYLVQSGLVDQYNLLVSQQVTALETGDEATAELAYREASALLPGELESYYQRARGLYLQQEYQACIDYINYDILENEQLDLLQARTADVYYLKAESLFALEDYSAAVTAYQQLFSVGGYYVEYYRDYAITLAYAGQPEQAEIMLETAREHGLEEDFIYYITGEIERALDHPVQAEEAFAQCITVSDNNELQARAYVMRSQCLEEQGETAQSRAVLLEAAQVLPAQELLLVYERLIQADIDLGSQTGDSSYWEEAVTYSHQVLRQGWGTYDTYDNLAVLYTQLGQADQAEGILEEMLSQFGEDYNIYKRYAFLERNRQSALPNAERDYTQFAAYYEQAVSLYEAQLEGNDTDPEMQLLQSDYNTIREGGWLS